jgi:UDP-glucose 4-epimerase
VVQRVLITGPEGFIGRNLVQQLGDGFEILAPVHAELDLLDDEGVRAYLTEVRVDSVLHCATHNATRTSTKDLTRVLSSNLRMFFNLPRCVDLFCRMYLSGSGAHFDPRHYQPKMPEAYFDTHVPEDDYGLSKYIMAKHAERSERIYDLRVFGCFGRYEDWRIRFISNAICKALFGMDITMFQNLYLDYLYVDDLARIVRALLERGSLPHHTYNTCSGTPVDLMTIAGLVRQTSGKAVDIRAQTPGLKPEYSGDNSRLLSEIGPFELTPLASAIEELYAWYEVRRDAIDPTALL